MPDVVIIVWSPIVIVALFVGGVIVILLIVLPVNPSAPANVAKVPLVGNVTLVPPVDTNVVAKAPDWNKLPCVDKIVPFAIVNVPVLGDTIIPFKLVAVATPNVGVIKLADVKVLFVNVSVPVIVE